MMMRHEQWDEHMSPLQDNQDGYDIAWVLNKTVLQDEKVQGCNDCIHYYFE